MQHHIDWTSVVAATLRIEQSIRYAYPSTIRNLRHRLMISPRAKHGIQRRITHTLGVTANVQAQQYVDTFGNDVVLFDVPCVEDSIEFILTADVVCDLRIKPHVVADNQDATAASGRRLIAFDDSLLVAAAHLRARHAEPTALAHAIADFVYDVMTYTPGATSVFTTAAEAFRLRRGVCQDYAHIAIAIARACGLSARYVSGHLIGEGATHAWVEFLIPAGNGRLRVLSVDPTNDCTTGLRHVVTAVGRDYDDVTPTSGVYTGTGTSTMESTQSVRILDVEYEAELAA